MDDGLLRPRSPVAVVDAAFALYRAHFEVLALIALILLGPVELIAVLVGGPVGDLIARLSGLLLPIVVGATVVVVEGALHSRAVSLRDAFAEIGGRWGLLISVAVIQNFLTFLGIVFLLVPGLLAIAWTFAAPMAVIVEHERSSSSALSRARQLARGQFWHILGTLALVWLVAGILIGATAFAIGLCVAWLGLSEQTSELAVGIAFILVFPIVAAASGILYFDLRVRTEAYDIERLTQVLDTNDRTGTPI